MISCFSGNFNGLHAGGPNCLLGASQQVLGADGQPLPASKPSLKASSSKQKTCYLIYYLNKRSIF